MSRGPVPPLHVTTRAGEPQAAGLRAAQAMSRHILLRRRRERRPVWAAPAAGDGATPLRRRTR